MPAARRMRSESEQIAALRKEIRDLRAAISESPDHESMVDRVDERDMGLPGLTYDEARAVTVEEYLANPEPYDRVIAAGPDPDPSPPGDPLPPAARRPTGMQPLNEHAGPDRTPLSVAAIRQMSMAEVEARKSEIDDYLSRGGR